MPVLALPNGVLSLDQYATKWCTGVSWSGAPDKPSGAHYWH